MLKVVVYVNSSPVAEATAVNVSNLADISNYKVQVREQGAPNLGIEPCDVEGRITGHNRRTSVWGLVSKIAQLVVVQNSEPDGMEGEEGAS